jgi:hypothetical protein
MTYLIALLGAIICIVILMVFVRAYDRHLKDLPGPWIMDEARLND